jgi:hypothetical protein
VSNVNTSQIASTSPGRMLLFYAYGAEKGFFYILRSYPGKFSKKEELS